MKRLFVFISVLATLALSAMPLPLTSTAAGAGHKERAIVEFTEQVKVLNVVLKGKYLIVHDDDKMARGEGCTYIYETQHGAPGKLIVSFHCTPIVRQKASVFTFRTAMSQYWNMRELREFQFAGSIESHMVPSIIDTKPAFVSLVP